jgi:hypothetical protein
MSADWPGKALRGDPTRRWGEAVAPAPQRSQTPPIIPRSITRANSHGPRRGRRRIFSLGRARGRTPTSAGPAGSPGRRRWDLPPLAGASTRASAPTSPFCPNRAPRRASVGAPSPQMAINPPALQPPPLPSPGQRRTKWSVVMLPGEGGSFRRRGTAKPSPASQDLVPLSAKAGTLRGQPTGGEGGKGGEGDVDAGVARTSLPTPPCRGTASLAACPRVEGRRADGGAGTTPAGPATPTGTALTCTERKCGGRAAPAPVCPEPQVRGSGRGQCRHALESGLEGPADPW